MHADVFDVDIVALGVPGAKLLTLPELPHSCSQYLESRQM